MDEPNSSTPPPPEDPARALYRALTSQSTPARFRAALVGAVIIAADEAGVEEVARLTYPEVIRSLYRAAASDPRAAAAVALVRELLAAGE